jgi:hypothetical protein
MIKYRKINLKEVTRLMNKFVTGKNLSKVIMFQKQPNEKQNGEDPFNDKVNEFPVELSSSDLLEFQKQQNQLELLKEEKTSKQKPLKIEEENLGNTKRFVKLQQKAKIIFDFIEKNSLVVTKTTKEFILSHKREILFVGVIIGGTLIIVGFVGQTGMILPLSQLKWKVPSR